jgi:hypothetical protein
MDKKQFEDNFREFSKTLQRHVLDKFNQWSVKGFIDTYKNIYPISSDTKLISKVLEIHILPILIKFAFDIGFRTETAREQNYYPDISFICRKDESIKFAVDIKTTYRNLKRDGFCNGFTLGSHGEYFINRESIKNIQFPYSSYKSHYCLGIIYTRNENSDMSGIYEISQLSDISSVIKDIEFFFAEKWKIASDKSGSGNTANIGSIKKIDDIFAGKGAFVKYGEKLFDDYWANFGKITIRDKDGKSKKITSLGEFLIYRGIKAK